LAREGVAPVRDLLHDVWWVYPDRPLTTEITSALARGHVRGADLWHLACALWLRTHADDLVFLTLDERQRDLAAALGLPT
jgi:hypothetical protein